MSQLQDIMKEKEGMDSVASLTSAFEGIASMHISRIKGRAERFEAFFSELWDLYSQLIVDDAFNTRQVEPKFSERQLVLIVTSEGSLSGDIDRRLVEAVILAYQPDEQNISVIGRHGATLLQQRGIAYESVYRMPDRQQDFDTEVLMKEVQQYKSCNVYYQSYVSLMAQTIKQIELSREVQEKGSVQGRNEDFISKDNYIFEPSVTDVVEHLEQSMKSVTIKEVILSSQLAQQASRFRAMSSARSLAYEAADELGVKLSHTKRTIKDERTREVINGIRGGGL